MSEECKAELHLSDDPGDNRTTFVCELNEGHKGSHRESFSAQGRPVVISFEVDHRTKNLKKGAKK